ncbi:MAG: histidine kinase [Firmicutes bacterium]|nr:histidine kinase [Bacillota bacterium]
MMIRKYFIRKLIVYFIAMVLPIIFLGSSFFFYTVTSLKDDINLHSKNISALGERQLELLLNTSSDLNILFSNNPVLTLAMSKILNAQSLNYAESNYQNLIISILNTSSNSKRFIDSVYLYQNNYLGNYFRSGSQMTNIKDSYDTEWLDIYRTIPKDKTLWFTKRYARYYEFEQPRQIISIFHRFSNTQGVIVFNLKPDELKNNLDAIQMYKSEAIIVTNSDRIVLFNNSNAEAMKIDKEVSIDLQFTKKVNMNQNDMFMVKFGGRNYLMTEAHSSKYDMYFISLVPEKEIYGLLDKIIFFVGLALLIAFCMSFFLSYSLTKKSFRQIDNILKILEDAENGVYKHHELPVFHDEYDTILHNILDTFIKNSYLNLQLNESKLRQKAAELTALQLQINPHFLFNTLETINMEILKSTHTASPASTLIENLSDILKYSLGSPDHIVTLREEIQYTKIYLNILRFRYPHKFMVFWDYDEDMLDIPIMRLLFQPLIENSLYHGIKPKQGKGLIRVRITKKDGGLCVRVTDNGIGIPKPELERLRKGLDELHFDERHIGLQNTNKRLVLSYGPQSSIKIYSKSGLGTVISFFIPIEFKLHTYG